MFRRLDSSFPDPAEVGGCWWIEMPLNPLVGEMRSNLLSFSAAGGEESLQLSVSTHKVGAAIAVNGPAQSTSSNEPAEGCNESVGGVVRRYVQMYSPGTQTNKYCQEGFGSSVPSPFGSPQPHRSSIVHSGVEERARWCHSRWRKVSHEWLRHCRPPSQARQATVDVALDERSATRNPVFLSERSQCQLDAAVQCPPMESFYE